MSEVAQQQGTNGGRPQRALSPVLRVSLLIGVGIHLAGFLVFRVASVPLPSGVQRDAFVQYVPARTLKVASELEEQAMLFDSAPLFIPTRWNTTQNIYEAGLGVISGKFPEFEPEVDLLGALESGRFPLATNALVEEPIDLLASQYWEFFEDFGSRHEAVLSFRDSQAVAQVMVVGGERSTIVADLDERLVPSLVDPVTYYLRVVDTGHVIGEPTLGRSSGNEVFDGLALQWLSTPAVLAQLPAGYLEITVYP